MRQPRWLQMLSAYWAVICSTVGVTWVAFNWGKDLDTTVKAHAADLTTVSTRLNIHDSTIGEMRGDIKVIKHDIKIIRYGIKNADLDTN